MKELFKLAATITMEGLEDVRKGLKSIDSEAKKAAKTLTRTGEEIAKIGVKMSTMITLPVAAAGAAIFKLTQGASDLSETISKSEQIFGDSAKKIDEWSDTAATAMGQSKKQAIDAASTFAIFGKSAGKSGDELVKFSTDFTQLASDFASFYNTSPEDAITAIGAAFRGENEPIRRYGILLDDASMRLQALKLGIIDNIKTALTPQQKVLAASALIMKQSSDVQGDFQRTSGGLANQQRILSAELKNLTDDLGKAFLPTVTDIVLIIRKDFVPILKSVANIIKATPPDVIKFATGMGLAAAAIGPLLLGLGKALVLFKDLQIAIKGTMFLLAGNPFGIAALAITGIGLAVGHTVSAWQKWKEEIGQKVESKQVSQMVKDLGELIPLYAELEDMRYGAIIDDDRFKQVSDRIKELETNLGDLGHEFTGSFGSKLQQAENLFDALTGSVEKNTEAVTKNKTVLTGGSAGSSTHATSSESPEDALKWEYEYNEAKAELGSYTNQKIIENDRLKNEELALNREENLNADIEAAKQELALVEETENKKKSLRQSALDFTVNSFNQLGSIMSMFTNNRLTALDQEYEKERENIENSTMSEEEKAKKLEALEKKKAERETAIKRKAAIRDKAIGIFNTIVDTATAIMKGFAQLGPVGGAIAAVTTGVMGALQTAAIASAPLPMAEGSLVESGTGGVNALIGEGKEDEVVFPLETGVNMMIDKLANGFKKDNFVSQTQRTIQSRPLNINVGSWLGDESGIKRLTREIMPYLTLEAERVGATI